MSNLTVSESTRLYVPADRVWALVGDFLTIATWHPRVLGCREERQGTQKCRRLDLGADVPLVERLERHDPRERVYTYTIVSGPLPIRDATGRLRVNADNAGSSTVHWDVACAPAGVTRADAVAAVQDYLRPGLEALRFSLGG